MKESNVFVNILDNNYYKFPIFPISANDAATQNLFAKTLQIITNIDWNNIYDNEKIHSKLFVDNALNKELLEFTNSSLSQLESIDKQVELILKTEKNPSANRASEIKKWLIRYFENQNKMNFPKFNSITTIRLSYLIVISILIKVYPEGIWCHENDYRKIQQDPRLKLYLPSHKSHLDYIIVHIMCIRFCNAVPTVVAGENLNVKFFGPILARLGAVYIKRNWFNYTSIMIDNYSNFFKFIVNNKIDIEVFIEGGRSRDGKLLLPKFGILKLIYDAVRQQQVPTVVVPISIQYEKVYEFDSINNELLGKSKHKESMINILRQGYTNLIRSKNYGKIFVQFGNTIDLLSYQGGVNELGIEVMSLINDASYITDISLINTLIYLKYHEDKDNYILIHTVVKEVRKLVHEIASKQQNLVTISQMDDVELTKLVIFQVGKFNRNCFIEKEMLVVRKQTDLIIYKNNLIHLFIRKSLIANLLLYSQDIEIDLHKLIHIFETQFISFNNRNFTKDMQKMIIEMRHLDARDLIWFSKILTPFIESYITFAKLLILDKDSILQNLKFNSSTTYVESTNKFYYYNFLKLLNDLKIYSQNSIEIDLNALNQLIEFMGKFIPKNKAKL